MPVFQYQASDLSGKLHKGSMEARDKDAIVRKLQEKSLFPIKIEARAGEAKAGISTEYRLSDVFQRIKSRDIMTFTGQLATLLNAGLTLERSLSILTELTENAKMRTVVMDILRTVQGGVSLADALGKHPRLFNKLYVNMIRAGERGGVLELVTLRLSEFLADSQEMKDTVTSAMYYPAFLMLVGGGSVIGMLTFVLPKFLPIFKDMGITIPWYTQLLMDISDLIKNWWWLMILVVIGLVMVVRKAIDTPKGRRVWDQMWLTLPVIGDLNTKIEVARFARTLGTLSTSGVPILGALNIVKEIVGNSVLAEAVQRSYNDIKEGGGVSKPLAASKLFPPLSTHMMAVGEETGQLEQMLLKVADTYEIEVKNAVKRAISLVEPLLIVVMGLLVGSVVISMLVAVFSVNSLDF